MDPTRDLDIEIEDRQGAGTGYPIRQHRDSAELRGPEVEVAPSRPASVRKVRREVERLGQPCSRTERALKRAFDLVGGAVLLIVLAPVWLTISLLIKVDSPGPILFRQRRIGQYGVPFRMFKFRTMVDGADCSRSAVIRASRVPGGGCGEPP
jgi:lipopolysaccharide/colanic/teichoic acid biosynthesis glycosyltransferase